MVERNQEEPKNGIVRQIVEQVVDWYGSIQQHNHQKQFERELELARTVGETQREEEQRRKTDD